MPTSLSAPNVTTALSATLTITTSGVAGQPAPTGTITVTCGSFSSCALAVAPTMTLPLAGIALPIGTDFLSISYSGDSNYQAGMYMAQLVVAKAPDYGYSITGPALSVVAGATSNNAVTVPVTPAGGTTPAWR